MFNFLKKNKIKSILKGKKRERSYIDLDNMRSVLVLFETIDYELVDSIVEKLEKAGKSVTGCGYRVKDDNYDYSETGYIILSPKENIHKTGFPSAQVTERLYVTQFDSILDFTVRENISLEYILASTNAKMKVGLKKNNLPLYDLSITSLPIEKESTKKESQVLMENILFYLQTIKTESSYNN